MEVFKFLSISPNDTKVHLAVYNGEENPLDVYFDGKYLGQVRGDEAGNGIRIRVKLPLGMIKKKKNHVLLVTAPVNDFAYCGLPGYQIVMDGFAIKGSP